MSTPATAQRKPAPRLPRPAARYWKGKAPKGAGEALSSDDSDYDAEQEQEPEEEGDVLIQDVQQDDDEDALDVQKPQKAAAAKGRAMNVALKDVNISKEGRVIVAGKEEVGRTGAELEGACITLCRPVYVLNSISLRGRGGRGRGGGGRRRGRRGLIHYSNPSAANGSHYSLARRSQRKRSLSHSSGPCLYQSACLSNPSLCRMLKTTSDEHARQ